MSNKRRFPLVALVIVLMTASSSIAQRKERPMKHPTVYRMVFRHPRGCFSRS